QTEVSSELIESYGGTGFGIEGSFQPHDVLREFPRTESCTLRVLLGREYGKPRIRQLVRLQHKRGNSFIAVVDSGIGTAGELQVCAVPPFTEDQRVRIRSTRDSSTDENGVLQPRVVDRACERIDTGEVPPRLMRRGSDRGDRDQFDGA
ncbi:MAG TPA: hypothetical protein VGD56_14930, partial [Gemmatirosa sp.]